MAQNKPHHDAEESHIQGKIVDGLVHFKPRALNIVWGEDNRYWRLPTGDEPAELIQVSWLEVTGKTKERDIPAGNYEVSFSLSLKSDAFGWTSCQPFLMAKVGKKGKYAWKKCSIGKDDKQGTDKFDEIIKVEVKNEPAADGDKNIYFGLYEVWSGKWKGGLKIHGAFIKKV